MRARHSAKTSFSPPFKGDPGPGFWPIITFAQSSKAEGTEEKEGGMIKPLCSTLLTWLNKGSFAKERNEAKHGGKKRQSFPEMSYQKEQTSRKIL